MPSASEPLITFQLPEPSALPVPARVGPPPLFLNRSILALISAVPEKVGVVVLVMLSVLKAPVSSPATRSGVDGFGGTTVSIVTLKAADADEMLPAGSVAVTVI